jgi:acyl-CoA synthetase (AMP-forming)/AMP-acid ligase II
LKNEYQGQITEDEIRDYCREHLASYAIPKYIEFRTEMPLTVTEKVFKKVLRDEALQKENLAS